MNTIIRYFRDKINFLENYLGRYDVLVIILMISLSVTSFALGFHAGSRQSVPVVTMTENLCIEPITEATIKKADSLAQGSSTVVASVNGSKYYFVWCSGVSRIALKNRIYFGSVGEAEEKGYTKASGCK